MLPSGSFLSISAIVTINLLLVGAILSVVRLVKGPHRADRIVALDMFSLLVVAILAALAILTGESTYIDVAIVYALVAFLGTVALARFLERSPRRRSDATNKPEGKR
jgi:multicomponent Na+:H+ antiporter subunit F